VETKQLVPEHYGFNVHSHSVRLIALLDFGCGGIQELTAPLETSVLNQLFSEVLGDPFACRLEHCWFRKKYPPSQIPSPHYRSQNWHQDGALGVQFPLQPGSAIPMTPLVTCWIPLNACGTVSPGLEFIRRRQESLLHFTELDDSALRRRFAPADFFAPALELGDGLVFLNGALHRTYEHAHMSESRMSVEYRLFPT
jgi:hypothetical protein